MIAAFMPRHFGFCLSVGLELGGFKFKSSLNLEQVCKNKKLKKFHFLFFTCTSIRPGTVAVPALSPSRAWIRPWAISGLLFLPPLTHVPRPRRAPFGLGSSGLPAPCRTLFPFLSH